MNIRPVKTENDYVAAMALIEELFDAEAGTAEYDKLEVLSTLVEAYEEKHHEITAPDPVEAIRFRMEQMGLEDSDMVPFFGQRSRVTEVLKRQRKLTLPMIRHLSNGLSIPVETLIGEYKLVK